MLDFTLEKQEQQNGHRVVCGVDEAGRGCLCGPVYAAAVILPHDYYHPKLNDSKKISPKVREMLFDDICAKALHYAVAYATVEEIEQLNILNASMLAMRRAIESLGTSVDMALIDGNTARGFSCNTKTVIHGDAKSASIAAASILAKVSRDRVMEELDQKYPQYELAKHKGYGTARHTELLRQFGPSEIHRPSFLKKILGAGEK